MRCIPISVHIVIAAVIAVIVVIAGVAGISY